MVPQRTSGRSRVRTSGRMSPCTRAVARARLSSAIFGKGEFVYDPKRDLYLCPAGKELYRAGKSGKGIRYRADTSACRDCPLKERCTPSEGARSINRYSNEEYVERVRAYRHT